MSAIAGVVLLIILVVVFKMVCTFLVRYLITVFIKSTYLLRKIISDRRHCLMSKSSLFDVTLQPTMSVVDLERGVPPGFGRRGCKGGWVFEKNEVYSNSNQLNMLRNSRQLVALVHNSK